MTIVLVGLNDRTAPLDIRERLHVSGDGLKQALIALRRQTAAEVVIVSTCNRFEIYASGADAHQIVDVITGYLSERLLLPKAKLEGHLYHAFDHDAARHLMRVACGLESMVPGESEILGQVATALQQAQQAKVTGPLLSRLFHAAVHAGKRARTETAVGQHTLSVSHVAVLLAKQQAADPGSMTVLVVGAGRMAELCVRALKAQGMTTIYVINRSFGRAQSIADRAGVYALEWGQFNEALRRADIIITATSAPQPILTSENFTAAHPQIVLDIAVPRNAAADVSRLPNVRLYDIDALRSVVARHHAKRQAEAAQVETIIAHELAAYHAWLRSRSIVPALVSLRQKTEAMAAAELERALGRLPDMNDHEREVVSQLVHRIVNKVLHTPTAALRERAVQGEHHTYLHAAKNLFGLEIGDVDE